MDESETNQSMKNLFALLTVIGAGFVAAPDAEARPYCNSGHTYVSHRTSCGCPVYKQSYIAYYDHCGNPVWRTRVLPVNHQCRHNVHYRHHGRHYDHGHDRSRNWGRSGGFRIGPVIVGGHRSPSRCR